MSRKSAAATTGVSVTAPSPVAGLPPTPPVVASSQDLEVIDVKAEHLPMRVERAPEVVLEEAHKAARALQHVIASKKHKVMFNGEQYLELEDWQTLARFYGLSVKVTSDKYIVYGEVAGFESTAEVIRTDGAVVSAAAAMCLTDEKNWKGKPLFQLRSMAQSRASAKAFRLCLSWVAVLAGYKGTPAEEMDASVQTVETPKSEPPIMLTHEQKTILTKLGNTLDTRWLPNRYGRELTKLGGFLPVRDLLMGLHAEEHGNCTHFVDAVATAGGKATVEHHD